MTRHAGDIAIADVGIPGANFTQPKSNTFG